MGGGPRTTEADWDRGRANAFNALQQAVTEHVAKNNITGRFQNLVVKVGTRDVTVRGNVVDGVAKIGTAFIPE